jgi:hypothetical protein
MNQSRFWWGGYTRCYASSYNKIVKVLFCWFELDFVNHVFIHQVIVVLKLYIRKLSLNVSEVLFAMNETKNMFHCTCTSNIIYIHITSKQNPRKLYLNIKHQAVWHCWPSLFKLSFPSYVQKQSKHEHKVKPDDKKHSPQRNYYFLFYQTWTLL